MGYLHISRPGKGDTRSLSPQTGGDRRLALATFATYP